MNFQILGPLEVRSDRGVVGLEGLKPRAVLAMLLLHPNEPVSAERLAVGLWGEDAPAGAVKTVQVHVSRLRKALGDPEAVSTTPAGYRLRVRPGELDAERFVRGVAEGRRALEAGDPQRAGVVLRAALELWHGPALADLEFEPFAATEIARLEEQHLVALEARVEADLVRGSHEALVSELQQLRAEHPTRERLTAQLMLALYRSGRQAEALDVYRDARQILVDAAGIEPGAELHRLHEAILRQDASLDLPTPAAELPGELDTDAAAPPIGRDVPVAPAADRRSALPASPNRTIGREREVESIAERLRAGSVRLLTLTGPGGVGKTRLALEAARVVEADFADGARFVSLAAIERSQHVPAAIVSALEIIPLAGESPERAVERFLGVKHLLLVVDNCEHLPGAAAFIGGLPVSCPRLTVLATSREPLHVQAEQLHPVPPLALPGPGTDLAAVAAVALFCERARAHDPTFDLEEGSAGPVVEICRRLDGLPLALELAAARCELLSASEIAERLDDAFGPGPRDAPARQQTLRATIDWSHDLLDDDERACFARFAVFSGGATLEAAETVTGVSIVTLDRLVAKSLLVAAASATGPRGWECSKRSGPTPASASRPRLIATRFASVTSATSCPWRNATGPIRRCSAQAVTSTSPASMARSRTFAPRSNGRRHGMPRRKRSSYPRRSLNTGTTGTGIRTRSSGSSKRCARPVRSSIQRCLGTRADPDTSRGRLDREAASACPAPSRG